MLSLCRWLVPGVANARQLAYGAQRLAYSTAPPSPPPNASDGEKNIHAKLTNTFTPSQLAVMDISGGCGTFYAITITSEAFKGLSTVKQHKLVTSTLKQEIEGIHGLQIKTTVP